MDRNICHAMQILIHIVTLYRLASDWILCGEPYAKVEGSKMKYVWSVINTRICIVGMYVHGMCIAN